MALFGSSPALYNTGAEGAPVLHLQENALRAAPLRPLQELSRGAESCRTETIFLTEVVKQGYQFIGTIKEETLLEGQK